MKSLKKSRRDFLHKSLKFLPCSISALIILNHKFSDYLYASTIEPDGISNIRSGNKKESQEMKIKITVLRKMLNKDFAEKYCQETVTHCPVFKEGQELIYNHFGDGNKPVGFCEHAWNDIYPTVMTLASKGTYAGWMKNDGENIVCCTDGIRPVVFKVERLNQ